MRGWSALAAVVLCASGLAVIAEQSRPASRPESLATKNAAALSPAWLTRQYDNTRTGNDPNEPATSSIANLWTAHTAGGSTTLDGQLYGTPLIYGGSVYVATENNVLYAFDTTSGNEQWHLKLASPQLASRLPCGNVSPNVGITSTPVIDPNAAGGHGVIYMAAMTSEPHYRLYGIDLVTHGALMNTLIDTGHVAVQNQRAALTLANGNIYIPFGGRAGDCFDTDGTPYYAIVVGVPQNGARHFSFAALDTQRAGIWGPGGPSADASGNLYVALGNGEGPQSESVIKLSPSLTVLNRWRPSNHQQLDDLDADVGSDTPGLVGGGNVFQNGKYGHAFMLSSSLTQLTADPGVVSCNGLTSAASYGAVAYNAPYIYAPCANGLYAWDETTLTSSSTPVWHSLSTFAGSPIVSGGLVWTLSSGNLYGFDPTTGATVTSISVGSFSRFQSPVTGAGRMFVAGTNFLKAFNMISRCGTATLSTTPASSQSAGLSVAIDATATGPNCSTPTFEYWITYPDKSRHLGRAFSATSAWTWDTTGLAPGAYVVEVWANQSGGQTTTFEARATRGYTLTGCTSTNFTAAPSMKQPAGSTFTFTATSSGCPNPAYQFWLRDPAGHWSVGRAWGGATWAWDTSGLAPGTYLVDLWTNQQGADTSKQQAYLAKNAVLTGCTSANFTTAPSMTRPAGSTFTFTATASGCPNPVYQFWLRDPAGHWSVGRAWGGATWAWDTSGLAPGTYLVDLWANQQGADTSKQEAYVAKNAMLTGCTSATLSPASGSKTAGSSVGFSATSGGCPNPVYQFWVRDPAGSWSVGRAWGAPTWTWDTTGLAPGAYRIVVWANQQGSNLSKAQAYDYSPYSLT